MNRQKIYGYILVFVGIYLLLFLIFPNNNKKEETEQPVVKTADVITLEPTKKEYDIGETVKINIKNLFATPVVLTSTCPNAPLEILRNNVPKTAVTPYKCNTEDRELLSGSGTVISFDKWNTILFNEEGTYTALYKMSVGEEEKTFQTTFEVKQKGWFGTVWDTVFYRPIYNLLIFLISVIPGNNLGLGIIFLTILIRFILLIPNQKALEQQKKLNVLQPKLNEIKKKYEGDQQKIGEETMKLWKEHKVNPMGSCLPLLLQLPFLIALYTAVANGLDVSGSYYLYEPLKFFNIESINSQFFGLLDLSVPNTIVLPIIIGVLQYFQMKLSFQNAKKNKTKAPVVVNKGEKKEMDPTATMNKSMLYVFPVLIGFMTAGFPAGVGLYWGVSTLFGIMQQIWVNKEKIV